MKLNYCPEVTARYRFCIFCFGVLSYACFFVCIVCHLGWDHTALQFS